MVGGYLSFQGIEGKANYANTALAGVLPVVLEAGDDREETPEGVCPRVLDMTHPLVAGLPAAWPALLGYQRARPKPGAGGRYGRRFAPAACGRRRRERADRGVHV